MKWPEVVPPSGELKESNRRLSTQEISQCPGRYSREGGMRAGVCLLQGNGVAPDILWRISSRLSGVCICLRLMRVLNYFLAEQVHRLTPIPSTPTRPTVNHPIRIHKQIRTMVKVIPLLWMVKLPFLHHYQ